MASRFPAAKLSLAQRTAGCHHRPRDTGEISGTLQINDCQALLIQLDTDVMNMDAQVRLEFLDRQIADQFLAGNMLTAPACLSPLPLAGIPGWWPDAVQDDAFYSDLQVFRLPPKDLSPAAIYHLI